MKESLLTLEETVNSVSGSVFVRPLNSSCGFYFDSVATDSRNVKENSLFVPLVGEKQDGHIYIHQAVKNGARVIFAGSLWVKENGEDLAKLAEKDVWVIAVDNTLKALQEAAGRYVEKFPDLKKVAITGSSGKTTTKEIAVSVFSEKYNVVYTQGNLNSETGLPLSVFNIRQEHEAGIFEMGMNRKGEMDEIASVLKPQFVLITNIGTAHIGILGSRENIAVEKKSACNYFDGKGKVFINADDDFADFLSRDIKGSAVFYSDKMEGISDIEDLGLCGTSFKLGNTKIRFPLYGKYNFYDALGVIALAKDFAFTDEEIKNGIEKVKPLFGRAEVKNAATKDGKKYTLILDCYNANPDSMSEAINFCSSLKISGKKYFVLGDMKELGDDSVKEHRMLGKKINSTDIACAFLFGSEMSSAFSELQSVQAKYYTDTSDLSLDSAVNFLKDVLSDGDLLLIKGSRSMCLERLADKLKGLMKKNEQ